MDAGTFSPYEHGEVYVLDDGGEVDLDLGNYERFLDVTHASLPADAAWPETPASPDPQLSAPSHHSLSDSESWSSPAWLHQETVSL